MAEYDVVDLSSTPSGQRAGDRTIGAVVGSVESSVVAEGLRALRDDLSELFADDDRLGLKSLVIKLVVSAEGKVAFIAKGAAEASIELTFERPSAV